MSTDSTCDDCLFKQVGKCELSEKCNDFIIYNIIWQCDNWERVVSEAWDAIPGPPYTGIPSPASWIKEAVDKLAALKALADHYPHVVKSLRKAITLARAPNEYMQRCGHIELGFCERILAGAEELLK